MIGGKFDLEMISKNYGFDRNYLIKMKNDTDFLYHSQLTRYFRFAQDSDPFLIAAAERRDQVNNSTLNETNIMDKFTLPISDDMLQTIKSSQFHILQEIIFYEIKCETRSKHDNTFSSIKSSFTPNKRISNVPGPVIKKHNELKPIAQNRQLKSKSPDIKLSSIHNGTHSKKKSIKVDNTKNILDGLKTNKNVTPIHNKNSSEINYDYQLAADKSYLESLLNDSKLSIKKHEIIESAHKEGKDMDLSRIGGEKLQTEPQSIVGKNLNPVRKERIIIEDEDYSYKENKGPMPLLKRMEEALKDSTEDLWELKEDRIEEPTNKIINEEAKKSEENIIIITQEETKPSEKEILNPISNADQADLKMSESEALNSFPNTEKEIFNKEYLSFKFVTLDPNDFESEYKAYLIQVSVEQKAIFKIKEQVCDYISGVFTKILQIKYKGINIGLCVSHIDAMYESCVRLVLSHFSVVDSNIYTEVIEETIAFLKSNIRFEEIFIELYYGFKDDQFSIDVSIRDVFVKKLKFKWITLENSGSERKVKYRLANHCENPSLFPHLFNLRCNVTLSLLSKDDNADQSDRVAVDQKENEINLFPVLFLLGEMIHSDSYEIDNENVKKINFNKLKVLVFLI